MKKDYCTEQDRYYCELSSTSASGDRDGGSGDSIGDSFSRGVAGVETAARVHSTTLSASSDAGSTSRSSSGGIVSFGVSGFSGVLEATSRFSSAEISDSESDESGPEVDSSLSDSLSDSLSEEEKTGFTGTDAFLTLPPPLTGTSLTDEGGATVGNSGRG